MGWQFSTTEELNDISFHIGFGHSKQDDKAMKCFRFNRKIIHTFLISMHPEKLKAMNGKEKEELKNFLLERINALAI